MEEVVTRVLSGSRIAFARFGDGEFFCIRGRVGKNTDGHEYFPDLGKRLKEVLLKSPATKGFQPLADVLGLTKQYMNIPHVNADVFHDMSKRGEFGKIIEYLRSRKCLVVGQPHHAELLGAKLIQIPEVNCWLEYEMVKKEIRRSKNQTLVFCASMMGTVLVDDFKDRWQVLDMGSVFEPYCGRANRVYHAKLLHSL